MNYMPWFIGLAFKTYSFNITLIGAWRESDSSDYSMYGKTLMRFFLLVWVVAICFSGKFSCISDSQTIVSPIKILCFSLLNLISYNKAIFQAIEFFYNKEKDMFYYFFTKLFTYKWAPPLIPTHCLYFCKELHIRTSLSDYILQSRIERIGNSTFGK